MKSLRADRDEFGFVIKGVSANGQPLKWRQTSKALIIEKPGTADTMPVVFDIEID